MQLWGLMAQRFNSSGFKRKRNHWNYHGFKLISFAWWVEEIDWTYSQLINHSLEVEMLETNSEKFYRQVSYISRQVYDKWDKEMGRLWINVMFKMSFCVEWERKNLVKLCNQTNRLLCKYTLQLRPSIILSRNHPKCRGKTEEKNLKLYN